MILPLLHERSCKRKKNHPLQQQQRNEPRKQTPTTTTTTTAKNLEKITQHHDHHNNNNNSNLEQTPTTTTTSTNNNSKRKLEKRILWLSGKFSRIYAQELQDEQASAMVNELIMHLSERCRRRPSFHSRMGGKRSDFLPLLPTTLTT
jgi:hypothetical protein